MPIYLALASRVRLPPLSVPLAHISYAIGPDGALWRSAPPEALRGGLLGLGDRCGGALGAPDELLRAIENECAERGFDGVLADFDPPVRRDRLELLQQLGERLSRTGKRLYVPEAFAVPGACVLLCTAVSGGSLADLLRRAVQRRGAAQLALDVQRLCMDFPLPCPSGEGRALRRENFAALRRQHPNPVFFSSALCARYFTYSLGGEMHLVLFDDVQTLRRKLQLGRENGIRTAFFMYPEVDDLLPGLFSSGRG
ncbi:MAG: hypothetical protein IIT47_05560 [Oscillospiraceae bacterium]|nr:hypothetical protein [Oscillospiraceae bacterium]